MPVKRRVAKVRDHRVTPAAVEACHSGGRLALHRALGLKPWEVSPLDVDDGPSPWPAGSGGAASWPKAQALRAELEARIKDAAPRSPA